MKQNSAAILKKCLKKAVNYLPHLIKRHIENNIKLVIHSAILYFYLSGAPLTPNITECIVYNYRRMVCKWEPTDEEQRRHTGLRDTNQTLYWTVL